MNILAQQIEYAKNADQLFSSNNIQKAEDHAKKFLPVQHKAEKVQRRMTVILSWFIVTHDELLENKNEETRQLIENVSKKLATFGE